jgi:adenylate cyclase
MNRSAAYLRWLAVMVIALTSSLLGFALWEHPWLTTVERLSLDLRMRMRDADSDFGGRVTVVDIDGEALAPYPYHVPTPRPLLAALIEAAVANEAAMIGVDLPLHDDTTAADDLLLEAALRSAPREVLAVYPGVGPDAPPALPLPRFARHANALGIGAVGGAGNPHLQSVGVAIGGRRVPSFPVAIYLASKGVDGDPFPDTALLHRFAPDIAAGGADAFHLDFHPPGERDEGIDLIEASALLDGTVDPRRIAGHIVLIGGGKETAHERFPSPFDYDGGDEGVGRAWITATAVATLMAGTTISPAPREIAFVLILLLSLTLAVAQARFGPVVAGGGAVVLVLLYAGGATIHFLQFRQTLPFAQFLLAIVITYLGSALYLSITEGREKRWIKAAFSRYLSPAYVDRLVADPSALELGGEERELTILFTDIAGFTGIAARLRPAQVVSILNRYFSRLTDVVADHGGTLDKYQGDAVMAFWGAPLASTAHAVDAVAAALAMAAASENLSAELAAEGYPPLRTRIGVNTGPVTVGNIGSERRFNYTIIGDAVNVASRLEGACRFYGARIVLSAAVAERLDDRFVLRKLDRIAVKGKEEPLTVYEVVGGPGAPVDPAMERLLPLFAAGETAYRERRWDEAAERFAACLAIIPGDPPSTTLAARSKALAHTPPPDRWDGVFRPDEK